MTVFIPAIGLMTAILLPWLCGYSIARLLMGGRYPISLYAGHGYLIGLYLVILLLNIWDSAGWPFSFWPIAGTLALITAIVGWRLWLKREQKSPSPRHCDIPQNISSPSRQIIMLVLALLIGLHLVAILQEVWLRPTFPWDAWRGWAPKTIQFFDNRALSADMRTIGNYGMISPLVHVWAMLGTGATHQPSLHMPWFFAMIALALAFYGHLRMHCAPILSLLGVYMVISLPYLNIHTSLAGYADLWLTLAFTLGVLTLTLYQHQRRVTLILLAVLYVVVSVQTKRAGLGVGMVLFLCLILASIRWSRVWVTFVACLGAVSAGLVYALVAGYIDIRIPIPTDSPIILSVERLRIPHIQNFHSDYSPDTTPFIEALSLFSNWHVTAYLIVSGLAILATPKRWRGFTNPVVFALVANSLYVVAYFTLVSPESAADHTALSRVLLYTMPIAIWWLCYLFGSDAQYAADRRISQALR